VKNLLKEYLSFQTYSSNNKSEIKSVALLYIYLLPCPKNIWEFRLTKIFVIAKIFAKIQNLSKSIGIPNIFSKMFTKIFVFVNVFVKTFAKDMFSKYCHVLAVLSRLPPGQIEKSVLSLLYFPSCPVPDVLSKTSCPDSSVLSWLSCPSCPPAPAAPPRPHWPLLSWHHCHVLAVLWSLSYPGSPVQAICRADLSRLSCPSCPFPDVLSQLSCPSGPVPDIMSQMQSLNWHSCSSLVALP
jgi:hypothetical protein